MRFNERETEMPNRFKTGDCVMATKKLVVDTESNVDIIQGRIVKTDGLSVCVLWFPGSGRPTFRQWYDDTSFLVEDND